MRKKGGKILYIVLLNNCFFSRVSDPSIVEKQDPDLDPDFLLHTELESNPIFLRKTVKSKKKNLRLRIEQWFFFSILDLLEGILRRFNSIHDIRSAWGPLSFVSFQLCLSSVAEHCYVLYVLLAK